MAGAFLSADCALCKQIAFLLVALCWPESATVVVGFFETARRWLAGANGGRNLAIGTGKGDDGLFCQCFS